MNTHTGVFSVPHHNNNTHQHAHNTHHGHTTKPRHHTTPHTAPTHGTYTSHTTHHDTTRTPHTTPQPVHIRTNTHLQHTRTTTQQVQTLNCLRRGINLTIQRLNCLFKKIIQVAQGSVVSAQRREKQLRCEDATGKSRAVKKERKFHARLTAQLPASSAAKISSTPCGCCRQWCLGKTT